MQLPNRYLEELTVSAWRMRKSLMRSILVGVAEVAKDAPRACCVCCRSSHLSEPRNIGPNRPNIASVANYPLSDNIDQLGQEEI